MTPLEFREQVLEALYSESSELLDELVDAYEPRQDAIPDHNENEALVAIGKFGCSGRTSRYKPHIDTLLKNGLQPNLTSCAYLGLMEQAKSLVDHDASAVNTPNNEGVHPLHAAAERGDLVMVKWLCDTGADPSKHSSDDELPILRAMHAGPWNSTPALDVVNFLSSLCGLDQHLWFAAGRGDVDRVRLLLNKEITNVDESDGAGVTSLFHACHNNHPEVVRLLLEAGADPNRATGSGDTPLATACLHSLSQECDLAIISMLLEAGATETIEAAVIREDIDYIRSYVQDHPHVLASDTSLHPLYYAVHTGQARSLETLVELGARPDDELWEHIFRIFKDDEHLLQSLRVATGKGETQLD